MTGGRRFARKTEAVVAAQVATLAVCVRLANNLRQMRDAQALSLHSVSERAHVERKYLRNLESAKLNPSLKTLERIAGALGMNVATLLAEPGEWYAASPLPTETLLALNLKRFRKTRSWSTADAETRIAMNATYLSYMETGRNNCTLRTLDKLAVGFNVTVSALLARPQRDREQKSKVTST
jgi:transcriptional regulator with XRE-family HTH domain